MAFSVRSSAPNPAVSHCIPPLTVGLVPRHAPPGASAIWDPVFGIGTRRAPFPAAFMLMPETAIDENDISAGQ